MVWTTDGMKPSKALAILRRFLIEKDADEESWEAHKYLMKWISEAYGENKALENTNRILKKYLE